MKLWIPTLPRVARVIAALSFFALHPALGQQLWSNATAGMNLDEVRAAFPDAVAGDKAQHRSGAVALLKQSVRLADQNFNADFFFLAGTLTRVSLIAMPRGRETGVPTARSYAQILGALRAKYGKELSSTKEKVLNGTTTEISSVWRAGQTRVELVGSIPDDPVLAFYGSILVLYSVLDASPPPQPREPLNLDTL